MRVFYGKAVYDRKEIKASINVLKKKYEVQSLDPTKIYESILNNEIHNGLPKDICEKYLIQINYIYREEKDMFIYIYIICTYSIKCK